MRQFTQAAANAAVDARLRRRRGRSAGSVGAAGGQQQGRPAKRQRVAPAGAGPMDHPQTGHLPGADEPPAAQQLIATRHPPAMRLPVDLRLDCFLLAAKAADAPEGQELAVTHALSCPASRIALALMRASPPLMWVGLLRIGKSLTDEMRSEFWRLSLAARPNRLRLIVRHRSQTRGFRFAAALVDGASWDAAPPVHRGA